MIRTLLVAACSVFFALALQACRSEPAESAAESARLSVPAAPQTAAPAAFRNLGKRGESES